MKTYALRSALLSLVVNAAFVWLLDYWLKAWTL